MVLVSFSVVDLSDNRVPEHRTLCCLVGGGVVFSYNVRYVFNAPVS